MVTKRLVTNTPRSGCDRRTLDAPGRGWADPSFHYWTSATPSYSQRHSVHRVGVVVAATVFVSAVCVCEFLFGEREFYAVFS